MSDARDVIYPAIHSTFVKYPKVAMLELEANGFQIVKKAN